MAGEEKPDRIILLLQALCRKPWLDRGERQRFVRANGAEQFALAHGRVVRAALREGENGVGTSVHPRAVGFECIESPCSCETLEHALADGARIDTVRKIRKIAERTSAARRHDRLDRLRADALERRGR